MRYLTPSDVRALLDEHGLAPSKRRGQNFVVDANTVRKVVRDAGVAPGTLVCEIGPGLGSLTLALRAAGATVVAVEIDAGLVRALDSVVGDDPGVTVVHADALAVDFAALLAGRRCLLVANLPYNVATPLIMHALAATTFTALYVMVQREVGVRWAARAGDAAYAAISVKLAALAEVEVTAAVPRTAFLPVPNVDSVMVRLRPRLWDLPVAREALFGLLEAGFSQRRKRLRNALAGVGHDPHAVEQALIATGASAGARAEELDLPAWTRLAIALDAPPP